MLRGTFCVGGADFRGGAGCFERGSETAPLRWVGTSARSSCVLVVGLPPRVGPFLRSGSAGAGEIGSLGSVKSCELSGRTAWEPFASRFPPDLRAAEERLPFLDFLR